MTGSALKVGDRLPPVTRDIVFEKMVAFETVVWDRGKNLHSDEAAAREDGLVRAIASGQSQMAFLHELLERRFGDAWVYGGKISVRYIYPVYADDRITAHGTVTHIDDHGPKPRVSLDVWCENQEGRKTAAGTASAGLTALSRSWIAGGAS